MGFMHSSCGRAHYSHHVLSPLHQLSFLVRTFTTVLCPLRYLLLEVCPHPSAWLHPYVSLSFLLTTSLPMLPKYLKLFCLILPITTYFWVAYSYPSWHYKIITVHRNYTASSCCCPVSGYLTSHTGTVPAPIEAYQ